MRFVTNETVRTIAAAWLGGTKRAETQKSPPQIPLVLHSSFDFIGSSSDYEQSRDDSLFAPLRIP